jgi:acylglycerol lipase
VRAVSDRMATRDGLQLPTRAWLPDVAGSERAALLLVHGLAEHCGRYDALATRLVREGYAVHAYDQRGHGYAQGPRCQVDRFGRFVEDLGEVVARVRAAHPGRPLVLFGHSMGGVVALRTVQTGAADPNALVLSSPALRIGGDLPGWLKGLLKRLAGPFPGLPTMPIDATALARDPDVVAAYQQDPAVFHGPLKARVVTELVRAGEAALAEARRLGLPTMIVHGKDDRIAQPVASTELHRALDGGDATLRFYDEGPHELFNDPLRERVLGDVLEWLEERLG